MAHSTLSEAVRAEMTDMMVRTLYSAFTTEALAEMVEIGKKYEADAKTAEEAFEARTFTEALVREIERRSASHRPGYTPAREGEDLETA